MNDFRKRTDLPRGFRNNNPGNIRISSSKWRGKLPKSSDTAFEQFTHFEWGLRAVIVLLQNYITGKTSEKRPRNTIRQIVERWAPAGDGPNNPAAYAFFLVNQTGIPEHRAIRHDDRETMFRLVRGIVRMENGAQWSISEDQFLTAWNLINQPAPPQKKKWWKPAPPVEED